MDRVLWTHIMRFAFRFMACSITCLSFWTHDMLLILTCSSWTRSWCSCYNMLLQYALATICCSYSLMLGSSRSTHRSIMELPFFWTSIVIHHWTHSTECCELRSFDQIWARSSWTGQSCMLFWWNCTRAHLDDLILESEVETEFQFRSDFKFLSFSLKLSDFFQIFLFSVFASNQESNSLQLIRRSWRLRFCSVQNTVFSPFEPAAFNCS